MVNKFCIRHNLLHLQKITVSISKSGSIKTNKLGKYTNAFSLIEMLMALLVASLLMAALAPVMTKRMNENIKVNGLGETYRAPADMQCYTYSDSTPSVDVSINDVYSVSFLIASAGGGGAGSTSTKKIQQTPIQITGTTTSDTTQEITITEYMTDIKAALVGAGGGGAGGAGYVAGCPTETTELKGNSTVKAFCMTKYNVGERVNLVYPKNYDYVPNTIGAAEVHYAADSNVANYCSPTSGYAHAGKCCWRVKDALDANSTANQKDGKCTGWGYSACNRTVCQFNAADNACKSFTYAPGGIESVNWNLPSYNQAEYLSKVPLLQLGSGGSGGNGIWLCNNYTSQYGYWCQEVPNRCIGSYDNWCHPYHIWVSKSGSPKSFSFANETAKINNAVDNVYYAFSARCTLEKSNLFKSYSGAGGAAGAYIFEIDFTEYVKQAGVNGKIILTAGKAGIGGNKSASNNTKASDGTAGNLSQIIIKKQNGDTVYGIRAKGGSGGKAAQNITAAGTAAINPNISSSRNCEYTTDGINWSETSCTKNILKGGNGEIKWKETAAKGIASISPISSNTSGYGAGGEGGTSSYGYNDKADSTQGTNGKAGFIKLTYSNEYPAAPGGGGGGGTVAQIKDVQLGRQAECKLTIGKGGKGGNIDNDGIDGGASSIKCNTDTRTFIVPGGKGGKKGTPALSISGINSIPIPGKGGEYGNIKNASTPAIKDYNNSKKVINEGTNGTDGKYNQTTKESIGGRGGTSGTGTKGACGGLYIEEDEAKGICKVSETDNKRIDGKGFTYEDVIIPNSSTLSTSLGIASAGGGGGGWIRNLNPGKGGDGMNGYVCVYWYNDGY